MKKGLLILLPIVSISVAAVALIKCAKCNCPDDDCKCCSEKPYDIKDDKTVTFHHPV